MPADFLAASFSFGGTENGMGIRLDFACPAAAASASVLSFRVPVLQAIEE